MTSIALANDLRYKGKWWLKEDPGNKVPGVLSSADDGLRLELFGLLKGPSGFSSIGHQSAHFRPKAILGQAEGRRVTLTNILQTGSTRSLTDLAQDANSPSLDTSEYVAMNAFVGAHLADESEANFAAMSVSFTHMEEWAGIERRPFETDSKEGAHSATFEYPTQLKARIESIGAKIGTATTLHRGGGGDWFRSLVWSYQSYVNIVPDEPRDFEWYWRIIRDFQDLLTLLVGIPVHARWIQARVDDEVWTIVDGELQGPIDVVSQDFVAPLKSDPPIRRRYWHWRDVLVPLSAVEPRFERVLNAWFEGARSLRPVYTLFFDTFYSKPLNMEAEFLSLAQALESYHSRRYPGKTYVRKEEFKKYLAAMRDALPEDVRHLFGNKLSFVNRFSLRDRLLHLLDRTPGSYRALISDDPEAFCGKVVDTRNYLTHYDSRLERKIFKDTEYFSAAFGLRVWLLILLLGELGIEPAPLWKAAEKFADLNMPRLD